MSIQVSSEAQRTAQVQEIHRREVRQQIVMPVVVVAVLLIVLPPIAMLLILSGRQFGIVASFAAVMVIVPMVLLCVVPYVLLLAAVGGLSKLNRRMPDLLRMGRNTAHSLNDISQRVSLVVSRPVMVVSERLAWLERFTGGQPPHAR